MAKNLFLIVGVLSIVVLGFVIFFRSPPPPAVSSMPERSPAEELEYFMTDKMDYGVRLSRLLAERRIEKVKAHAAQHPDLAPRAREVADSIAARLERKAKM
jgi:hypothetical protein